MKLSPTHLEKPKKCFFVLSIFLTAKRKKMGENGRKNKIAGGEGRR